MGYGDRGRTVCSDWGASGWLRVWRVDAAGSDEVRVDRRERSEVAGGKDEEHVRAECERKQPQENALDEYEGIKEMLQETSGEKKTCKEIRSAA